jgi:RND family efflux transporter MFP subunit
MFAVARKKWFWGALFFGATLGAALWMYYQGRVARDLADPGRARQRGEPIPVRTVQVVEQAVEEVVGGTATTIPSETAVLQIGVGEAAGLSGLVVREVKVKDGTYVRKGGLLFQLEDQLLQSAVLQHKAEVAGAEADVARAEKAVAEKAKLYAKSLAAAEADLGKARATLEANEELRKLALAVAESDVRYHKADAETRHKHREDAAALYKKENNSHAASYYYEARSKYAKAVQDLAKSERDLQQAKRDLVVGRLTDQDAIAKAEKGLQQARTDAAVNPLADREAVAKAQSGLEGARGRLAAARKEVEECAVRAPVAGLVDGLTLVRGQRVKQLTPLASVLQIDPLFVKMDFPQERLGEVRPGQQAEVVLDCFPGETFKGKVVRILPKVDTHTRVLPVYIELANPRQRLRPGVTRHRLRPGVTGFARLRAVKPKALVLPAAAVLSREGKAVVFRVEAGRARIREVRTGPPVKVGMVEITRGLDPGDEVVLYSNFYSNAGSLVRDDAYLQDNDRVDANWRRWARRDD